MAVIWSLRYHSNFTQFRGCCWKADAIRIVSQCQWLLWSLHYFELTRFSHTKRLLKRLNKYQIFFVIQSWPNLYNGVVVRTGKFALNAIKWTAFKWGIENGNLFMLNMKQDQITIKIFAVWIVFSSRNWNNYVAKLLTTYGLHIYNETNMGSEY